MQDVAKQYLDAGLCVLPARRAEKRPTVGAWKQYQKRRPTEAELSAWMANDPDAICILCGSVSDNAEIIDFDAGGELFSAWWERLPAGLRDRLVVEITPSGGYHVIYRCQVPVCGN
ncbi:MAG: bifunctional DNA primase/polymerase, partial [Phycisphaeraceae bacterium]